MYLYFKEMTTQIKALSMDFSYLLAFGLLLSIDPVFQLAKKKSCYRKGKGLGVLLKFLF